MPVEIGSVMDARVQSIKPFGAFVVLSDGKPALLHISEIAHGYVSKVEDHLKVGDEIKVKVVELKAGKIGVSIKAISAPAPKPKAVNFEDMMSSYLKDSDEKQRDSKARKNRRGNGHNKRR